MVGGMEKGGCVAIIFEVERTQWLTRREGDGGTQGDGQLQVWAWHLLRGLPFLVLATDLVSASPCEAGRAVVFPTFSTYWYHPAAAYAGESRGTVTVLSAPQPAHPDVHVVSYPSLFSVPVT